LTGQDGLYATSRTSKAGSAKTPAPAPPSRPRMRLT
jgi:hypothetical protein